MISTREVQAVARTKMNSHLGYLASNRSPIAEIAGFSLAKARGDPGSSARILQAVEPGNEFFRLADDEHASL